MAGLSAEQLKKEYLGHFHAAIDGQSDFACVLIVDAFLHNASRALLRAFMVDGDASTGLSSNALLSRSQAAQCHQLAFHLGLVSASRYRNLRKIGEIRNRFGHSMKHLTFDDPDVSKLCNELEPLTFEFSEDMVVKFPQTTKPRVLFVNIATFIAYKLVQDAQRITRQKPPPDD